MGYYSNWEGDLFIEPPYIGLIDEEVHKNLKEYYGSLLNVVTAEPAIVREFSYTIPITNHTGIKFRSQGEHKAYGLKDAVTEIVNWFNDNTDSVLSGMVTVYGEDSTDIWRLKVIDGLIVREEAVIAWPDGTPVESNY